VPRQSQIKGCKMARLKAWKGLSILVALSLVLSPVGVIVLPWQAEAQLAKAMLASLINIRVLDLLQFGCRKCRPWG